MLVFRLKLRFTKIMCHFSSLCNVRDYQHFHNATIANNGKMCNIATIKLHLH